MKNSDITITTHGGAHTVVWINKDEVTDWLKKHENKGRIPKQVFARPGHYMFDPHTTRQIVIGWYEPTTMDRINYEFK